MKDVIKPFIWQPCLHDSICALFPPHHICIVYTCICESFSLLVTMLNTFICRGSFHDCIHVGRLIPIFSLIVWHIAAAPLLARFDRSFVISIEYSYVRFFTVLLELRRRCPKSYASLGPRYFLYCFSLPSTMTTTCSLLH